MMAEDKQWEIKVSVPMRLPVEQRQELFAAVVGAVEEWEPAPAERDGWDADVAGCPAAEWPEIVRLASSRQAWAEEALRLEMLGPAKGKLLGLVKAVLLQHVYRIDDYMDSGGEPMKVIPAEDIANIMSELERRWEAPAFRPHKMVAESDGLICACVPDAEATALVDAGWSLPQCTVHPEGGQA